MIIKIVDAKDTLRGNIQILNFLMNFIALLSPSLSFSGRAIVQFLILSFLEPIAVMEYPMLKLIKMTDVMLVSESLLARIWSIIASIEIITICGIVFGESKVFNSFQREVSTFFRDSNSGLDSLSCKLSSSILPRSNTPDAVMF